MRRTKTDTLLIMSARAGPLFITILYKIPLRISPSPPIHPSNPPPPPFPLPLKKGRKEREAGREGRTGNSRTDILALKLVVRFHVLLRIENQDFEIYPDFPVESILNIIVSVLLLYAEWNFKQSFVHE